MESSRQQIQERAATFLQKRGSGQWSDADQAELTAWIEASTANRITFLRIEAAWEEMGRLKALGAGLPRCTVPTPEALSAAQFRDVSEGSLVAPAQRRERFSAWRRPYFAMVGTLLLATSIAFGSYQLWFAGDRYATPVGGVASVPLPDGSRITLNTSSKVRVVLSAKERLIDVSRGEAFFAVAKDQSRPFVVQAGRKRVIAVGTQFSVRREGDDLKVVVVEGTVRLENGAEPALSPSLAAAGTIARIRASSISLEQRHVADAEEILSWRSGYLVFHDTPLAAAVAEFNRYNSRRIVIHDPAIAGMKLTGKFGATNHEAFVDLLEQTFHIHARRTPDEIVLTDAVAP